MDLSFIEMGKTVEHILGQNQGIWIKMSQLGRKVFSKQVWKKLGRKILIFTTILNYFRKAHFVKFCEIKNGRYIF